MTVDKQPLALTLADQCDPEDAFEVACARELRRLHCENEELKEAARINLENYEFQRRKADRATAAVYQFHYAMKDAGWHPGRTDDDLTDIIRKKGKELNEVSDQRDELLEALELFPGFTDDATIGDSWLWKVGSIIAKTGGAA